MTLINAPGKYEAALNKLMRLYKKRNQLLRKLGKLAEFAGGFTPADTIFMQFDYDWARGVLAQVEAMDPKILAAIDELNRHAKEAGKPVIEPKNFPTDIL